MNNITVKNILLRLLQKWNKQLPSILIPEMSVSLQTVWRREAPDNPFHYVTNKRGSR